MTAEPITHSEELLARVRADLAKDQEERGYVSPLHISTLELITEYAIAIEQNLAMERGIHALCKRIEELPDA